MERKDYSLPHLPECYRQPPRNCTSAPRTGCSPPYPLLSFLLRKISAGCSPFHPRHALPTGPTIAFAKCELDLIPTCLQPLPPRSLKPFQRFLCSGNFQRGLQGPTGFAPTPPPKALQPHFDPLTSLPPPPQAFFQTCLYPACFYHNSSAHKLSPT